MAFPAPAAAFLDENLQIHGGKRTDASRAKPLKSSAKPGLQERKALQDLSNMKPGLQERKALRDLSNMKPGLQERKALRDVSNMKLGLFQEQKALQDVSKISKVTALKQKSALRSHEAIKNPGTKTLIFADKETTKCHEWAKDGVEGAHFTGNDYQKFDKNAQDKRVKKKVEKVMSALHGWSDVMVFDPVMFPAKEVSGFIEEVKGLELEPEILPDINRRPSYSGRSLPLSPSYSGHEVTLAEESFTDDELDQYPFLDNEPVEFVLRDEPAVPTLG